MAWYDNAGVAGVAGMIGGEPAAAAVNLASAGINALASTTAAAVNTTTALLRTVVSTITSSVGLMARTFIGVVGVIAAVTVAVVSLGRAAADFSRNITALRDATGLGNMQAAGVMQRFGAFGVNPQQMLGSSQQNPAMFRMRAGIYGLPGYESPDFLPSLAGRYQSMARSGPLGQQMARQMLGNLEMDNPQVLQIANLPVNRIREQQASVQNVSGALGLSPDALKQVAQDFDLLTNRVQSFGQITLAAIGQRLLPYLTRGLEIATRAIEQNGPRIGQLIDVAVQGAVQGFGRFAHFLITTVPEAFFNAADFILRNLEPIVEAAPVLFTALRDGIINLMDAMGIAVPSLSEIVASVRVAVDELGAVLEFARTLGGLRPDTVSAPPSVPVPGPPEPSWAPSVRKALRDADERKDGMTGGLLDTLALRLASRFILPRLVAAAPAVGRAVAPTLPLVPAVVPTAARGLLPAVGRGLVTGTGRGLGAIGRAIAPAIVRPLTTVGLVAGGIYAYNAWRAAHPEIGERARVMDARARTPGTNPILNALGIETPRNRPGDNPALDWVRSTRRNLQETERGIRPTQDNLLRALNELLRPLQGIERNTSDTAQKTMTAADWSRAASWTANAAMQSKLERESLALLRSR